MRMIRAASSVRSPSCAQGKPGSSVIRPTPITCFTIRWRKTARPRSTSSIGSPLRLQRSRNRNGPTSRHAQSQNANFQPTAADWNYYAEQIRKQRYDLNQDPLKPYFEMHKVLTDGVFYAANQLYGLMFKERRDLPTWSPDSPYEVIDWTGSRSGSSISIIGSATTNRAAHGWITSSAKSYLRGTKPVVYNVANFTKPAPGQPALISWDDVTTMFHEFGHALHGLFASADLSESLGTNVARDFVEFPSQFNENWALDPKVLAHYAVNYQDRPADPAGPGRQDQAISDLQSGLRKRRDARGRTARPRLAFASRRFPRQDVDKFEAQALRERVRHRGRAAALSIELFPPHLEQWLCGRLLRLPVDSDVGTRCVRLVRKPWRPESCKWSRFRDMVLSRGDTLDYGEMYRSFTGHDPEINPYLEHYGLPPTGAAPLVGASSEGGSDRSAKGRARTLGHDPAT